MKQPIKMILDLDTGIDDSMALAYALASDEIELIGVTSVFGNVLMETGAQNTLKMLDLLGNPQIPVYKGSDRPHSSTASFVLPEVSRTIHGEDGVGNIHLAETTALTQNQGAVDFIIQSCKEIPDLVIVPTGPLTNIASAIEQAPEILSTSARIVLMGGALTICGNVTPFAEANIYNDPEAADKVLRSAFPITMVGLDVTLRTYLTKVETAKWRSLGTQSGKAFADMVDYYIDAYGENSPFVGGCALHDPLAVAVAIHPEFVETLSLYMKVETEGESRGRTIGNNDRLNEPNPNAQVAIGVHREAFLDDFTQKLSHILKN